MYEWNNAINRYFILFLILTVRGAPAHVQNSVHMSERTDRKVLFERAELGHHYLQLINGQLQINLYLTDRVSNKENNNGLLHDCLYAAAHPPIKDREPYQIIPYCMGEWKSRWDIQENNIDQKFTFTELLKQGITSEQLYLWSAPMDTIESYQFYLNQLPNSKETSISNNIFHNCTLPNFGPKCQYALYDYKKDCWQIEIHKCDEDEFRCLDGQCIPLAFLREKEYHSDCLDLSDRLVFHSLLKPPYSNHQNEPYFGYEDISCVKLSNDLIASVASSCVQEREELLSQAMFSVKPKTISYECWTAVKCIIQ